ncbi:hypothetical protein ACFOSS_15800 [Pseudaeromonas sharmana]|uniref:DUF2314 domain-containing protein n=1 Tax=Pseudaeromonas sharmana TaxID=328412 RepID=A0ABV8CSS6_9GAMM
MSLRVVFGAVLLLLLVWGMRTLDQQQTATTPGADSRFPLADAADASSIRDAEPWLGKTGLSAEAEQQLIRFVHMKLGEQDDDPSALQPDDMLYLGAFEQDEGLVRYWLLSHRGHGDLYATVTGDGSSDVNYGLASSPPESMQSDDASGEPMEPDDDLEEESSLIP